MTTNQSGSSASGLHFWVALLLALLLAAMWLMGYGPGGANCKPAAVAEVAAPVAAAVAPAVAPAVVPPPAGGCSSACSGGCCCPGSRNSRSKGVF
jgi:hypothetical protein